MPRDQDHSPGDPHREMEPIELLSYFSNPLESWDDPAGRMHADDLAAQALGSCCAMDSCGAFLPSTTTTSLQCLMLIVA